MKLSDCYIGKIVRAPMHENGKIGHITGLTEAKSGGEIHVLPIVKFSDGTEIPVYHNNLDSVSN